MTNSKIKKTKKILVFSIVFILFSILFFSIAFFVPSYFEKVSLQNTTQYSATIVNVEIKKTNTNNKYCIIYTQEYGSRIMIRSTKEIINLDDFNALQMGDIITFRIESGWVDQFDTLDFIYVVELKTQEKEIVTLESINKQREIDDRKIKITATVSGVIFLLMSSQCILLLKGINIFKKKIK